MIGECSKELQAANKPSPRTCAVCGLGPCRMWDPLDKVKIHIEADGELKLRQWCVEQAALWPTESSAQAMIGGPYPPLPRPEIDLLARADRILKWVKGA